MSLIGKKAPLFTAPAVINGNEIVANFSLSDYIGKKEVVLFFYPKDFTFVCPTEILEFQNKLSAFKERNVEVIGISTDTEETHLAWISTPKNNGGIEGVTYPLVADTAKTIAVNYGVLGGDWQYDDNDEFLFQGDPIAYRGTFFIDKTGVIRHEYINFFPIGRNIDDTLRIVDAWQCFEKRGEVCPANWIKGKDTMVATKEGVADYLSKH